MYEAAVLTDRLPGVMQEIADSVGAIGATFMTRSGTVANAISSPRVAQAVQDYIDEGWAADPSHNAPLFAEMHPGFRAEADYRTPDEIARMPVHAEFLDRRGYIAGVASVIQGTLDHIMHFSIEGFPSHDAAMAAVPILDKLRPDLARALTLSAITRSRANTIVASLQLVGIAAGVTDRDGTLRATNDLFVQRLGRQLVDGRRGVRFADRFVNASLAVALKRHVISGGGVQSVVVRAADRVKPCVLHLLPIVGAARDVSESDGILLILADPENRSVPNADLLKLMFDLTPAEARLARVLAEGRSVAEAARRFNTSELTVKTQLRSIFAKTGTSRQLELVLLLGGLAPPGLRID
jgi:DNA-binding CsgD family transcriptional regulator